MTRKAFLPVLFALAILAAFSASLSAQSAMGLADGTFAYTGDDGPYFWPQIRDGNGILENTECAETSSSEQSPIDIDRVTEDRRLEALQIVLPETTVVLQNPGYTIVVMSPEKNAPIGGSFRYEGRDYALMQFHFHTLSEHTVEGRHGAMELHLVFRDPEAHFAVIGVLYRIGSYNPFLEKLIAAGLPSKTATPAVTVNNLPLQHALTDTAAYFTYNGSLTTPPCHQGLKWIVLRQWAELSAAQYESFRHILGNNFRPIQPINGRIVHTTAGRHE